jgi:hypothetical protein
MRSMAPGSESAAGRPGPDRRSVATFEGIDHERTQPLHIGEKIVAGGLAQNAAEKRAEQAHVGAQLAIHSIDHVVSGLIGRPRGMETGRADFDG